MNYYNICGLICVFYISNRIRMIQRESILKNNIMAFLRNIRNIGEDVQ